MTSHPALALLILLAAVRQQAGAALPQTVASVDLRKFAGTYYEIARFPSRFQDQCTGDVTATYSARSDGRIDVVNRCRTAAGVIDEARGVAKPARGDRSNAKLKVRFAPAWLSLLPAVWGDYWVLGTGPDYGYLVVGEPARKYLWILSRVARMPDLAYRHAVEIAKSNGYDVEGLVRTPQRQQHVSGSSPTISCEPGDLFGCN